MKGQGKGWRNESHNHRLASMGIKTKEKIKKYDDYSKYEIYEKEVLKHYQNGFTNKELKQLLDGEHFWKVYSLGNEDIDTIYLDYDGTVPPRKAAAMKFLIDNDLVIIHDGGKLPQGYEYSDGLEHEEGPLILLKKIDIKFETWRW